MNVELIQRGGGGGGQAFLSDVNFDLINTYQVIQRDPEPLIKKLREYAANHSKDYYYGIRGQHDLDDRVEIAARFIYLNKTCFNGLWRVNSKGEFNVPMGSSEKPAICQSAILRACNRALQGVRIHVSDFHEVEADIGDFVYFDPPYHPLESAPSFTSYSATGFGVPQQLALRDLSLELCRRGALVMLSNSDTEFIRDLYDSAFFNLATVKAPRMINCKGDGRGVVNEVLITNYRN